MKRVSLILIIIIGLLGLSVTLQKLSLNSGGPDLIASEALAGSHLHPRRTREIPHGHGSGAGL